MTQYLYIFVTSYTDFWNIVTLTVINLVTQAVGKLKMSTQEKARALMQRRYQLVKHRQQSVLGRTGQELGCASEISNYWNPIQGKLNPANVSVYERNNVTFS